MKRFAILGTRTVGIVLILLQSVELLALAYRLLQRGLTAGGGATDHRHFLASFRAVVADVDAVLMKYVGLRLSE